MWLDFTYSTTQREMCELNDNVSNVLNQRIIILIETLNTGKIILHKFPLQSVGEYCHTFGVDARFSNFS